MLHFDSDYMRGAHPAIIKRLSETNMEMTTGYGTDPYCERARELILDACDCRGRVYFLVGGTQTNSTVIDGLLRRHEGVISAATGHINVHESGAIESTGHKVLTIDSIDGKLSAADVRKYIDDFYSDDTYEHMVAPGAVYISQPTELGTLYSLDELKALSKVCREKAVPLYLDGARLGYALASPCNDVTLRDIASLCDVFYIGGTKVGALFGEAVVVANDSLLKNFTPLIKQHGAMLAKGRLLGLQFETLFTDGLYEKISCNAIDKAMKLKKGFVERGIRMLIDSPTNQQFFILPNETIDRLMKTATFELWGPRGEKETPVRFVTDWATTDEDIEMLIAGLM